MIVNNVGVGNVGKDDQIDFEPSADGGYRIISADGQRLEGQLSTYAYREVTAPGEGPWKVEIGIDNFSRTAVAIGVESNDTALSAFFSFPAPPNGAHMFVSPID